jgi:hypothetical protein
VWAKCKDFSVGSGGIDSDDGNSIGGNINTTE